MKSLQEKEWLPFSITELFNSFVPGKGKGLNHLIKTNSVIGISYIGATNRNNGILCYVEKTSESMKLIQPGNCIGFIKNGDGSAGYAIYKAENFISTSDVIYGYTDWLNEDTGLFFVAAQDMIENKYSHGYKRNMQHLSADRVMLPVTETGEPDYEYMAEYARQKREDLLAKYREYVAGKLSELGDIEEISKLEEKTWNPFYLVQIVNLLRGRENNMALLENGNIPLISAKSINNGLKGFVSTSKKIVLGRCITLNNDGDGGAGLAYYQPCDMALDTHVTALIPKGKLNKYSMMFIAGCISGLHGFFGHGLSIANNRAMNIKIMLPINDVGNPDYEYMEQYVKNLMIKKYRQYLEYLRISGDRGSVAEGTDENQYDRYARVATPEHNAE